MIPEKLTVGDQWQWAVTNATYPASAGWEMSYALVNADNQITITSTADGDSHVVDFDSAGESAGSYQYQQFFVQSGNRTTVDTGSVEIAPDFSDSAVDGRSHVKKTLDAICATIEGQATKAVLSYTIEGRSLARRSYNELLELKHEYQRLWTAEKRKAAIANGQSPGGRVLFKLGAG